MSSLNEKGRSRYSKVLPDPPPGANVGIWHQQFHHKPLPIPASLSPGIPINSDKVNPLRSVTSVQSMNSLMSGNSARSPPMIIFRRHKVSRPSPDSDEEPPALSHSWSDSSSNSNSNSSIIIEGKEPSSSSSFDPEFEPDIHSSPPPPPPPANEKPKIFLSDHLLNSPHSFFCKAKKDKNNNNNNHNQKNNHSNHSNHHYDHQHRDDDIVAPLNIPSRSLASEFWRCRPARIDVHRSLIDLRSEHNHSSLRKKRGPAVDQPSSSLSSSPKGDEFKRVFSIQRRESPSSSSTPRDLMGNKLVRLKKSLGDLKSCPIYHEGDHPGLSAYRDRKKSPLPTSTTTNNVSSSFSSFRNEKSHDLLHQPASRDRSSRTAVSHSDSHHATSLAASSQSSASTTRAPTIPSSEALTLRSDSSMTALPQLQPHIQRHPPHPPPPPPSQYQQPSHPHSHSDLQSPTDLSPPQSNPQPTFIPEFPTTPSTGEIIFRAPPLNVVQLECYQKHRSMRSSRNKLYPVGCMICQKIDAEMRWRCTWCCLSACEDCNHKLSATTNKDLKSCLEQLGLQE
ncbi:hypothetical protein K3495_g320 [Podosphaera aphanis]|nr:hypothetical protein K3495_g320 [Podosphaera aphanis]